jgi:hypothetical protein
VTNAEAARRLLLAVAEGRPVSPELIDDLVRGVLETEPVRLALEVRSGGPHALRRALELAALLAEPEGLRAVGKGAS